MSQHPSSHPSLLAQFRSFCYQNKATDFEKAVEYFAVFGGMGWAIDMTVPLDALIEQKVLDNYRYIHADITEITHSKPVHHAMLTAIATGDRREHSAFKKIRIERQKGVEIVDFLIDKGLLLLDASVEKPLDEEGDISDKLLFATPFMRFWFAMVSPTYKSIREGDYSEFRERWLGVKNEFATLIYTQLVWELVSLSFKEAFGDDPIVKIGSYYDRYVSIDILAKRKSGAYLAGTCRYGKSKVNRSELAKLKESCRIAKLDNVENYVIFSKNKFSSELKNEIEADTRLFSMRHLSKLMDNLSGQDLIVSTNKKY